MKSSIAPRVEFLSDATGTLTIGNDSGKIADKDLHNSVLVTQASMFSKGTSVLTWLRSDAHSHWWRPPRSIPCS